MSETQEMRAVPEAQQPVADAPDYSAQVDLLKAKNQELIGERRNDRKVVEDLQKQLAELQASSQKQKQAKLAEAGEFKTLYEDLTRTYQDATGQIAELQKQLEQKDVAYQAQQIKAQSLNSFTQNGVGAADHLYTVLKDSLRLDEGGNVTVLHGGVQVGDQVFTVALTER